MERQNKYTAELPLDRRTEQKTKTTEQKSRTEERKKKRSCKHNTRENLLTERNGVVNFRAEKKRTEQDFRI